MRNFFNILKFEYLTCIRNKAFIIITVFLVCGSLLFSFLPGIITSIVSDEQMSEDDNTQNVIAVKTSDYSENLVISELSPYYPTFEIRIVDEDRNVIEKKVNDSEYQFAIDINSPVSFVYITKNNSLYTMDENLIMNAVQNMFTIPEFENKGLSVE